MKHQRAFHRLLLSLAIMDNIYLVCLTNAFDMDFTIFWQDCLWIILIFLCKIASALTFSLANLSPAYDNHAWNYIVPYR